jgi:hypothetical protein
VAEKPKLTLHQAKAFIRWALEERDIPFTKLTARTVGFHDLARGESVFVKIHGWKGSTLWEELRGMAHHEGFCLETDGAFG